MNDHNEYRAALGNYLANHVRAMDWKLQILALGGDVDEIVDRVIARTASRAWTMEQAFEYERDLLAMGSKPL